MIKRLTTWIGSALVLALAGCRGLGKPDARADALEGGDAPEEQP